MTDTTDPDPIEGRFGQVVMTGWIGETPEGRESPYLMMGTPDDRAPVTMPLVAEALGLDPTPGSMTPVPAAVRITLDGDRWISVRHAGAPFTYRVSEEWERMARQQRRVVLVLYLRPLPDQGMQALVDGLGDDPEAVVLALAPAH